MFTLPAPLPPCFPPPFPPPAPPPPPHRHVHTHVLPRGVHVTHVLLQPAKPQPLHPSGTAGPAACYCLSACPRAAAPACPWPGQVCGQGAAAHCAGRCHRRLPARRPERSDDAAGHKRLRYRNVVLLVLRGRTPRVGPNAVAMHAFTCARTQMPGGRNSNVAVKRQQPWRFPCPAHHEISACVLQLSLHANAHAWHAIQRCG